MRIDDLLISIAYFSIPIQILVSLYHYPLLPVTPRHILVLFVLFALFIFFCGAGHLMHALEYHGFYVRALNVCTAIVSITTAVYLVPFVPCIMSALNELVEELKLKEELEETKNRKLMTFMGFLCHEIRNPLFAITSSLSFLSDSEETFSEDQKSSLSSIRQSANLMLRLVNDVLDISKLESGRLELEEHEFNLHEMLVGVSSSIQGHIKYKHQDVVLFDSDIAQDVPKIVCGDSVRVLQIVYNLLSNAAKFTEKGFVRLSVSVCDYSQAVANGHIKNQTNGKKSLQKDEGKDFSVGLLEAAEEGLAKENCTIVALFISVVDTGPGMTPEQLSSIFQPYSQSKLSDYRKHGGTGLGLSIVSRLTDIMGGTIRVMSEVNVGSTFTVCLPVSIPNNPKAIQDVESLALLNQTGMAQRLPILLEEPNDIQTVEQKLFALVSPNTPGGGGGNGGAEQAAPLVCGSSIVPRIQPVPPSAPALKTSPFPPFYFPPRSAVVLIVDDNIVNCKILVRMLSSFNLETLCASNGQEAVDIMDRCQNINGDPLAPYVALIFMDLCMPVMDGCTAIGILREQKNVTIPIVALTANAIESRSTESLRSGATEFATKPILREDLYQTCRRFLLPPNPLRMMNSVPSIETPRPRVYSACSG